MKKKMLVLFMSSAMIILSACGTKDQTSKVQPREVTEDEMTAADTEETDLTAEDTAADVAADTTAAGTEATVTGLITDAAMNSFTIQAEDGSYYLFAKEDDTTVDCADGLILGEVIDVTYSGTQESGDAVAIAIKDSAVETKAGREAIEYALVLIQTMEFMDQDTLGTMLTYPCYVCSGDIDQVVDDQAAFSALNRETLFSEDLLKAVADYNLFNLESTEAGYVLGDGKPNVIFKEDTSLENGFGVTGINGNK